MGSLIAQATAAMEQLTARKARSLETAEYLSISMLQPTEAGTLPAKHKELPKFFIASAKLPWEQLMVSRLFALNLARN